MDSVRVTGAYSEGPVALSEINFLTLDHFCGGGCGRRVVVRIVLIILMKSGETGEGVVSTRV